MLEQFIEAADQLRQMKEKPKQKIPLNNIAEGVLREIERDFLSRHRQTLLDEALKGVAEAARRAQLATAEELGKSKEELERVRSLCG